jgi:hypothetical protein
MSTNIIAPFSHYIRRDKRTVTVIILFWRHYRISARGIVAHASVNEHLDWVVKIHATYFPRFNFDFRIRDGLLRQLLHVKQ